jgi:hypothetical protein
MAVGSQTYSWRCFMLPSNVFKHSLTPFLSVRMSPDCMPPSSLKKICKHLPITVALSHWFSKLNWVAKFFLTAESQNWHNSWSNYLSFSLMLFICAWTSLRNFKGCTVLCHYYILHLLALFHTILSCGLFPLVHKILS